MHLSSHLIEHMSFMILMILLLIFGVITAHRRGRNWLKLHWRIVITGVISGLTGFLIMFIFKLSHNYSHFMSDHSKIALISLILVLIAPSLGLMVKKQILKRKIVHKIFGYVSLIFCLTAATFGLLKVFG